VIVFGQITNEPSILLNKFGRFLREADTGRIDNSQIVSKHL